MTSLADKLKNFGDITSMLTLLAALPYEKDTMALFPPSWTPWIIKIGIIATLLLRFSGRKVEAKSHEKQDAE